VWCRIVLYCLLFSWNLSIDSHRRVGCNSCGAEPIGWGLLEGGLASAASGWGSGFVLLCGCSSEICEVLLQHTCLVQCRAATCAAIVGWDLRDSTGGTAGCWETNCIPCFIHWLIHLVYTHNSFMKLAHFNDLEIMTKYSTTNLRWQLTNHIPSFHLSIASWAAAYTTGSSACISADSVLPSGSPPHQIFC